MKPMTKERREEIERWMEKLGGMPRSEWNAAIRELLDAEAYWRNAVKNADVFRGGEPCVFCDRVQGDEPEHEPDCPWVRAQG